MHMFWTWKLSNNWQSFFIAISDILGMSIDSCLWSASRWTCNHIFTGECFCIAFAPLVARRKILLLWKSSQPPFFKSWLHDLLFLLKLEKIKFSLRGCPEKFYSHWKPLLDYVDKLPASETSPRFYAHILPDPPILLGYDSLHLGMSRQRRRQQTNNVLYYTLFLSPVINCLL